MDEQTRVIHEANQEMQRMVAELATELGLPHAELQSPVKVLAALRTEVTALQHHKRAAERLAEEVRAWAQKWAQSSGLMESLGIFEREKTLPE